MENYKYKIVKWNGYTKEKYGNIKFKGEYLNGKRNGKGKEYYKGKLIFEGEYLNGKRWKGKAFNHKGKLLSEFENGNGYGIEYITDEYITKKYLNSFFISDFFVVYEGKFLNGERYDGIIEEYYEDKLFFVAKLLNGEINGEVKEFNKNGDLIFEGEYLNGKKWNGKGYKKEGEIEYEIKNGNGYIKEYNIKGNLIFEGEYLNGDRYNGKEWQYETIEKDYFLKECEEKSEIEYLNGKRWNKVCKRGSIILFRIEKGYGYLKEFDKYGKLIFEGEYLNGERNGYGKEYNYEGFIIYEGEYLNGKRKISSK